MPWARQPGHSGKKSFDRANSSSRVPSGPAPGFRDSGWRGVAAGGTLHQVGNNGYSWSSTITGSHAHFLYFYYYGVYPQHYDSRAYGLQLRCLQEEVRATTAAKHLLKKFGLAPTPLKAVQNPGWSAQRHRRGRAMQSIVNGSAKFSVRSLTAFFLPQPCRRDGRPTPPPAEGRCRSAHERVGRAGPMPRRGPTLSGKINLFPLPRSSRGGSYFL